MNAVELAVILAAYLIGAIPFGWLVAWLRGVDITQAGSGNIGATNVGRVLGKKLGILVFVLDFLKGALPTLAARFLVDPKPNDTLAVFAGLAAVLGHMFPIYLRFRGGKGVATGAGVVFMLVPAPAALGLAAWLAVLCAVRYVSVASVAAAAVIALIRLLAEPEPFAPNQLALTIFCILAALLVLVRHRSNLQRLFAGTEPRLQDTTAMLLLTRTVHVLSLGLWFGTVVFFIFVGIQLFGSMTELSAAAPAERPGWLPTAAPLQQPPPKEGWPKSFPEPLSKEQGGRLFGRAIGPLFKTYFTLQTICGVLALATAFGWSRGQAGKVHQVRTVLLTLALLTVIIGWWLDREVVARRDVRAQTSDTVLLQPGSATQMQVDEAHQARLDFNRWHGYSVWVNLGTLVLVTIAMALAAQLPATALAAEMPKQDAAPPPEKQDVLLSHSHRIPAGDGK
ncbi:MAG: glycerol-3-phosphate 1-O-acyltransferase PlsY [Planctomycetia bacterium]|nr:glycerol-3-phosphate 1-O-acyltransferase PlsY [Planctomycetia bacterium]